MTFRFSRSRSAVTFETARGQLSITTSRKAKAKRLIDLLITIPSMITLMPLFLLIMAWVKMDSRGPVFFRQRRVGQFGEIFLIFKFRTMVVGAEKAGPQLTIGDDDRITRCGRLLRRYKLDELPQLFNVLKGEMGLVGPRPEVPRYVALYTSEQRRVIELLPGVTSPSSIAFCQESDLLACPADPERAYVEEVMPEKIRRELEYAAKATIWSDFLVLLKTFSRILTSER